MRKSLTAAGSFILALLCAFLTWKIITHKPVPKPQASESVEQQEIVGISGLKVALPDELALDIAGQADGTGMDSLILREKKTGKKYIEIKVVESKDEARDDAAVFIQQEKGTNLVPLVLGETTWEGVVSGYGESTGLLIFTELAGKTCEVVTFGFETENEVLTGVLTSLAELSVE